MKYGYMDGLGESIYEAMRRAGMTQAETAEAISVNESTVSRWVNGKREPCAQNIRDMCRAFGCTADQLLGIKPFEQAH